MVILIMGVAGSGKTTVGQALAAELGWIFADADDFHPPANVAKMAAGEPLTDADRAPWLAALRDFIAVRLRSGEKAVVACSALKQSYRAMLAPDRRQVPVVHLQGSPALIKARLGARRGHFLPPTLADSQFATLEPPADAVTLDAGASPAELVAAIRRALHV